MVCRRNAARGACSALGDLMRARLYRAKFWAALVMVAARILYELRRM
jgi:hypothetical protein